MLGVKEVFESGVGVLIVVNSIGIVYNKEKLGKEIKNWDDLWLVDLKGKIFVLDVVMMVGFLMLYVVSEYVG